MKEGKLCLKRSHNYFYQVQQQLSTCHRNHNDFVCAFDGQDKAVFVFERIYPDPEMRDGDACRLTQRCNFLFMYFFWSQGVPGKMTNIFSCK